MRPNKPLFLRVESRRRDYPVGAVVIPDARRRRLVGRKLRCKRLDGRKRFQVDSFRRLASHQAVADSEPIEPRKPSPTKSPKGCSERIVGIGMAEPFRNRRRLVSAGKNWVCAPVDVPGVEGGWHGETEQR